MQAKRNYRAIFITFGLFLIMDTSVFGQIKQNSLFVGGGANLEHHKNKLFSDYLDVGDYIRLSMYPRLEYAVCNNLTLAATPFFSYEKGRDRSLYTWPQLGLNTEMRKYFGTTGFYPYIGFFGSGAWGTVGRIGIMDWWHFASRGYEFKYGLTFGYTFEVNPKIYIDLCGNYYRRYANNSFESNDGEVKYKGSTRGSGLFFGVALKALLNGDYLFENQNKPKKKCK